MSLLELQHVINSESARQKLHDRLLLSKAWTLQCLHWISDQKLHEKCTGKLYRFSTVKIWIICKLYSSQDEECFAFNSCLLNNTTVSSRKLERVPWPFYFILFRLKKKGGCVQRWDHLRLRLRLVPAGCVQRRVAELYPRSAEVEQLAVVGAEEGLLVHLLVQILAVAEGMEMPPMALGVVMFESSALGKKMQLQPGQNQGSYQQGAHVVLHVSSRRNAVQPYSLLHRWSGRTKAS